MVVAGTRKNTPGTRRLSAKALRAGGAGMHRLGLSETLLVFAEHRLFLGTEPPARTVACLRATCPEKRVVVEVSDLAEALAWRDADVLQLEKLTPEQVAEVVTALAAHGSTALVAAAGGVNAANAEAYARAGARLLVTSALFRQTARRPGAPRHGRRRLITASQRGPGPDLMDISIRSRLERTGSSGSDEAPHRTPSTR